ncbi:MAG: extra-cytoplasmic solute receptor family protein [Hyphomicrobiales bacterium]|nr:extra-cytoplasmic solute receptor family protein [Hyphomicrobiales bacterium]
MGAASKWACRMVLCGASLATTLISHPASAQEDVKAYYAGKTVRMIVGSGPGGGYDVFSRMIAPYLSKVLGTTVVVENRPGAGGLSSMNFLYTAPPDGLTLSLANGSGAAFAQLTNQSGVRYDLTKFHYLATVGAPPSVWLVDPNSPIKTIAEALARKEKWRWAASGVSSGLAIGAAFTCVALHKDCQVVAGYSGSNQAALALTRGEMDAMFQAESSAGHFVKSGEAVALATMSRKRSRLFPDHPTIFEAADLTPDQSWYFDFYDTISNLGRIMIVPPSTPPARVAYLQAAMKETLHNPQLIADGERAERYVDYLDPESTLANARKVISEPTADQKRRVLDIIAGISGEDVK